MKSYVGSAKELSRGVFWVVDDELLAFPYSDEYISGYANSGLTYNHNKLWPDIKPRGCNEPYNYYPRGRVDIDNKGRAIIYLNPNIDNSYISNIKTEFGIVELPIIKYDNSAHYRCYLGDGWKPDK